MLNIINIILEINGKMLHIAKQSLVNLKTGSRVHIHIYYVLFSTSNIYIHLLTHKIIII